MNGEKITIIEELGGVELLTVARNEIVANLAEQKEKKNRDSRTVRSTTV